MYEFYLSRTRTTLSVIRLNVYCASRTIMHRFRSARATIPFRAYCMYTGEEFRLRHYWSFANKIKKKISKNKRQFAYLCDAWDLGLLFIYDRKTYFLCFLFIYLLFFFFVSSHLFGCWFKEGVGEKNNSECKLAARSPSASEQKITSETSTLYLVKEWHIEKVCFCRHCKISLKLF